MKNFLKLFICAILLGSINGCNKEESFGPAPIQNTGNQNRTNCSGVVCTWEEDFTSPINPTVWNTGTWFNHRFRYPDAYSADPWSYSLDGSGDWANKVCVTLIDNSSSTLYVSGGSLKIKSGHEVISPYHAPDSCDFSTGYMETQQTFGYGYYEINAKIPAGNSIGAAFWLKSIVNPEEIDVFESRGWLPNTYITNVHYADGTSYPYADIDAGMNLTAGFHTYGILWSPTVLEWYIDNKKVKGIYDPTKIPSNQQVKIILSVNLPDAETPVSLITSTDAANTDFQDFEIKYVKRYDTRPTNALFKTSNTLAQLTTISDYTDWGCNWDIIVPGNFNGDAYTDLLLYSRAEGAALFVYTDGDGNVITISSYTDWSHTWDQIIPGNFGGTGLTDLILYDKTNGDGMAYSVDGSYYWSQTDWSAGWDLIVPGNFDLTGTTDLAFYNKTAGSVTFFKTNTSPGLTTLGTATGLGSSWTKIVPGNYDGVNLKTDLLFYNQTGGTASFYKLSGYAPVLLKNYTGWRTTWNQMVAGNYNGSGNTDLLFYDKNVGEGYFFSVDNSQNLGTINSYNNWSTSWEIIVAGQYGSDAISDLLFYNH